MLERVVRSFYNKNRPDFKNESDVSQDGLRRSDILVWRTTTALRASVVLQKIDRVQEKGWYA